MSGNNVHHYAIRPYDIGAIVKITMYVKSKQLALSCDSFKFSDNGFIGIIATNRLLYSIVGRFCFHLKTAFYFKKCLGLTIIFRAYPAHLFLMKGQYGTLINILSLEVQYLNWVIEESNLSTGFIILRATPDVLVFG